MAGVNVFDGIPDELPHELTETLLHAERVRIERIVSWGHTSPEDFWYDQDEHEWLLLLRGSARLAYADPPAEIDLVSGDYLLIPAHQRHRVQRTDPGGPTVWLAIFFQT